MKTITDFVNVLKALFRPSDIGAYFVPIFRPMVREQDRLHPIRVAPTGTNPLFTFLSGLPYERPRHL